MTEKQPQFHQIQVNGLPPGLQALIDQVNAEQVGYQGREDDVRSLNNWLAKGDLSLAEHFAEQIVERQQQYRQIQVNGLPPGLQALIDQVNAEQVGYQGREDDVRSLNNWLAKGDISLAEHFAEQIVERQQQYRQIQVNGLPPGLQALIDQVNAEQVGYQGREDDVRSLNNWLAKGDISLAEHFAEQIVERQQQYRQIQVNGLPPELQALIDQVNAEQVGYQGREDDVRSLNNWLAKGDVSLAVHFAEQIVERQRNIRILHLRSS